MGGILQAREDKRRRHIGKWLGFVSGMLDTEEQQIVQYITVNLLKQRLERNLAVAVAPVYVVASVGAAHGAVLRLGSKMVHLGANSGAFLAYFKETCQAGSAPFHGE